MSKKKTALQRLAFKIAEDVAEQFSVRINDVAPATEEDLYHVIYQNMPFDMEAVAAAEEEFVKSISGETFRMKPKRPSIISKLRDAVHADKGTPLGVVLEAAIRACEERDNLLRKEDNATPAN